MTTIRIQSALCLLAVLTALPALAAVEGTVTTQTGVPIESARVDLADHSAFRITDTRGHFLFEDLEAPAALVITHPRFQTLATDCCSDGAPPITLVAKQQVFDEIVVTANRESSGSIQPLSVPTSSISAADRAAPVADVVELIDGMPGVAEAGQGGLFQAYSIRGTGGQRVMTLVSGARIVTERRAGATASFIDPLLLETANVVRGSYSTYYGSGALGGVLEAVPKRFSTTTIDAGWESQGNANYQVVGLGLGRWSLGVAHRGSGKTETPDGTDLPSQFDQFSASVARTWDLDSGIELDLMVIPSIADDIGKPNRRYPSRVTTYPDERHLVTRFAIRRPGVWHLDLYGHPNSLDSQNVTSHEQSLVKNRAFDFGLNLQRELALPAAFAARVGFDYFGRRGVKATETVKDLATGASESFTTLDGSENEAAVYGSVRRNFGPLAAEVGARFTYIDQTNAGSDSVDDTATTGFIGFTLPVGGGFELVANVGSGFRFPGLSERYYSGSTGRGEVIANSGLDPEQSLTTDLGLRFFGDRLYFAAYVYRNEIDDYIERIDIEPGVRTYVNLTSGTIKGFELEGFVLATDRLRFEWSGMITNGEADDGAPLAEIPSNRFTLGGRYTGGPWRGALRWQHRFEMDDPGPGEEVTAAADIVSASVGYVLRNGLELSVFGANLLNETYQPTADDLAVPAPGRSIGIAIGWSG